MPEPIPQSTNELIELARKRLRALESGVRTDAHRATLAFWLGGPFVGLIALMAGASMAHDDHSGEEFMIGIACLLGGVAVIAFIFLAYLERNRLHRRAEVRLEHLGWIETRARAGLLTDNETRRELLHLMR